jgi:hypothetical protein
MPDPTRLPDFVYGRTTYVVEKFEETGETLAVKYILRTPRGGEFLLIADESNFTRFFVFKSYLKGSRFKGKWFTERDGALVFAN